MKKRTWTAASSGSAALALVVTGASLGHARRSFAVPVLLLTALAVLAVLPSAAQAQPEGAAAKPKATAPSDVATVQKELVAITREILDSVSAGKGKEVWTRYLLPDCIIADSFGHIGTRAEIVGQLPAQPSPANHLEIANPTVRVDGDTAILSYDLTERQDVYGQAVVERFHTTDTYVRRDGAWRVLSSQGTQLAAGEPPVGRAHPESYASLVGTYRIAPEITYTVTREGDHLFGQRNGRPKEELLPETPDVFFRRGIPGQRIFDRDESGKVVRMIDRQAGQDLVWARVEKP
jgi:Domain of unknown function (DUF4440)/Domain of unknown function (DUF3471)